MKASLENLAPIVLFVYNRATHAERTLEALMANELSDQSELFIYADGPKKNQLPEQLAQLEETRKVIRKKNWCKTVHIIELEENYGVDELTVQSVTFLVNKYEKIIVLEDDIVTSRGFLKYMNEALHLYENEEKVMSIAGYAFPFKSNLDTPYFIYGGISPWGWATWKRAWNKFEPDYEKSKQKILSDPALSRKFNFNNSYDYTGLLNHCSPTDKPWDIRWYASVFLEGGLGLWPHQSLVQNIGHDKTGVHGEGTAHFQNTALAETIEVKKISVLENSQARKEVSAFFKKVSSQNIKTKIKDKFLFLLRKFKNNKIT